MTDHSIEILTYDNPLGAVHRMKIAPLMQHKPNGWRVCRIGEGSEHTVIVIINGLYIDPDNYADLTSILQKRMQHAVIMLIIPDIGVQFQPLLAKWSKFVDVFLVPTPEMQNVLQLFTERRVEVLPDPIDFSFTNSYTKNITQSEPLKVVWFGFPDSYQKSMSAHENTLIAMHQKKEIEYHIVTDHTQPDDHFKCILHRYDPATFPELLSSFDVCIASHIPADFDINTYCKSENKAVLAINRGVPVIASRTPAYERLLTQCVLEEYLFTSNTQMVDCIKKLQSPDERNRYLERSQSYVLKQYSTEKMVQDWVKIYERVRCLKFG